MLKLINLYVLQCIFREVEHCIISDASKMLYIKCLTQYFKDKAISLENAMSFEMSFEDYAALAEQTPAPKEIRLAGLVEIRNGFIYFPNLWYPYMEKEKLNSLPSPMAYVGLTPATAEELREGLKQNDYLYTLMAMQHKITRERYNELADTFVIEQLAFEKKHVTAEDCKRHFTRWIPYNVGKALPVNKKKTAILGE